MDKTISELTQKLKNDPTALRTLIQSKDGQKLMQLLTQQDNGRSFQQAVYTATRGDTAAMTELVQKLMYSEEGASLIRRIRQTLENA